METYHGHVRTPNDAILLFEACRIGVLPRVQRRLSEKERQQIKSGSVFVWDEREAGMRRWTDGKSWSASRVSGSFLTYREMEGKRGGNSLPTPSAKRASGKSPDGSQTGDSEGEGPDGYRYKPDGLMKQSFSITTSSGQHLHLISYYSRSSSQGLQQPSADPQLRHIRPPKNMYPESTVNETQTVPAVTRGPMPGSPYAAAPHTMGGSPSYARPPGPPGPTQPMYVPVYPPTPPNGTPPLHHAAYYGHPYPFYGHLVYAQPYPHPQGHVFDRPPPPVSNPHAPPAHHILGYPPHPPPGAPQYIPNPPARAMQATEIAQQQPQPNAHQHPTTPSATLPEQGPQLPAINAGAPASSNKPPTPEPSEPKVQAPPPPAESANAASRPLPTLGSILNGDGADKENQNGSRSRSRSPNSAQRPIRELPPERIASNSKATDSDALAKLTRNMFVRT